MHPSRLQTIRRLEAGLTAQERLSDPDRAALRDQLLGRLLAHAHARSPFWRGRIAAAGIDVGAGAVGLEGLARAPVLTRGEMQAHFEAMRAWAARPAAGEIATASTSGSTGAPVRVEYLASARMDLMFAMARRHDAWHGRDVTAKLAVISDVADSARMGWRPDLVAEGRLGPVATRNMIASSAGALWDWLADQQPRYLTVTVSMARALAEMALAEAALADAAGDGQSARRLRMDQVMSYGEVVSDETCALVAAAFGGARLTSIYGCQEASWLALECGRHPHLHVMDASCLIEIVRPDGSACAVGEPGKVLVTALHSHAMPVIRYDIGDVAEWGAPCDCGVGGPVLARVLGRERSFLLMPDGQLRLARITGEHWREVAPVEEYRLVQYADGLVEAWVRCARPLSGAEREGVLAMLREVLDPGLAVVLTETDAIVWPASGKREDIMRLDRLRG